MSPTLTATLNQLVRETAETMPGDATPAEIAAAVIAAAGDRMGEFLLELVTDRVYAVLGAGRRASLNGLSASLNGRPPKAGRRRSPVPDPSPGPDLKHRRSPKVDRHGLWWAEALKERVPVGDGEWKRLGDCTIDDLQHSIAEREALIGTVRGQINNYASLIAVMRRHGAARVSDLTADQVQR
jgi:hypothetical protein